MRVGRRILLSTLTIAAVATPAAASANDAARPVVGARSDTLLLDTGTGAGQVDAAGVLAHVGSFTGQNTVQFVPAGPTSFVFSGTTTLTAANGDELFTTFQGSGTNTSATTSMSTSNVTITGGTGRFEGATGTVTETINSTLVSLVGTTATYHDTATDQGTISY